MLSSASSAIPLASGKTASWFPPNAVAVKTSIVTNRCLLGIHERVVVFGRGRERFLYCARVRPAHEVHLRSGLVVRARCARAAERLLAHDRARWFVVDIEISGRVAQGRMGLVNRPAVVREHRAGERIR